MSADRTRVPLTLVAREWSRIGVTGFGGPPTHVRMLRDLCVTRCAWIDDEEFENALAACALLPGPASTQLAIFTAWRVAGPLGAIVGGLGFVLPGLVAILVLAWVFLAEQPSAWLLGAAAGAGSAVAAVAVHAAWGLVPTSWRRRPRTWRWVAYVVLGAASAATLGPWVVAVLLGCGVAELLAQRSLRHRTDDATGAGSPALLTISPLGVGVSLATLAAVAWVALKVGALSYGGGFVIVPLMQADAVDRYHWMTAGQFLTAVSLGQVTPGPVVHTVAVVGYAAAGLLGGLLAAVVAFSPSFALVLLGARHFDALRTDPRARASLDGSGPASIGAILGSAVPLARALTEPWQFAVLAASLVALLALRRGVVPTLLVAAGIGVALTLLGANA